VKKVKNRDGSAHSFHLTTVAEGVILPERNYMGYRKNNENIDFSKAEDLSCGIFTVIPSTNEGRSLTHPVKLSC
jgi:hypothetical protein